MAYGPFCREGRHAQCASGDNRESETWHGPSARKERI
jgi:hypothetical protein